MDELYQISVENGNLEPKQAVKYLRFIIASVRANNGRIVKVWHGNADTFSRGRLKEPIRAALRKMKREGTISFFICGEDFTEEDAASRYMIDRFPLSKEKDQDWGKRWDTYVMICL